MADKSPTEQTRALVQDVYGHFKRGDLEAVGRFLAEDIEWFIEGPNAVFGFCGQRKGRAAAMEALRMLTEDYEHLGHEARFLLADGNRACLFARATIRHRATGQEVAADICDLMEIADGKITWFREVFDTLSASEQMARAA